MSALLSQAIPLSKFPSQKHTNRYNRFIFMALATKNASILTWNLPYSKCKITMRIDYPKNCRSLHTLYFKLSANTETLPFHPAFFVIFTICKSNFFSYLFLYIPILFLNPTFDSIHNFHSSIGPYFSFSTK
jgi:hypothetical protein